MRSPQTAIGLACAAAIFLALASGGLAQTVGVTGAVNPETTGAPPGSTVRALGAGSDVVYNERIATQAQGQAEILFVDRSSLTIGPNSEVVIDEFVYSPESGAGKLAVSATKGLFRFVGGALSKNQDAVSITTPAAIVGIRGGVALVAVGPNGATTVIFLYGVATNVESGGGKVNIGTPGFMTTIGGPGQPPSPPTPVDPAFLQQLLNQLAGHANANGGAAPPPTEQAMGDQPGIYLSLDDDLDIDKINLRDYLRPVDQFDIPQIEKLFKTRQPVPRAIIVCTGDC